MVRTRASLGLTCAPRNVAPQVKPGKGPAFVRTKLKNIETRATLDKTWRAGESYPDADVDKQIMQYSYIDGDDHVFMNMGMHTHGARTTWRKPHDMHICMHMELEPRTNRPDYPADTLARPDYNRPGCVCQLLTRVRLALDSLLRGGAHRLCQPGQGKQSE